ncbi:MAG: HRDC domain-containing protein [Brevibacterium sp.]|uniref:HRDC domain-containing protein n=1 Tax=Brevibacterium sp. TaxID=1701 RepID=UPI00264A2A35|nr:HRDC domain-containing protein [Brevibacterium sp.]MDN6158171.1 HRDC domain-containing protein [Brevibacterium sp.]MDN6175472.1 HRDC domain-containing protein [Brevibacterium sp.]MDN6188869.1 HRDC domain-containing protein [Brevibacterium sp.]MDN6190887.1 HRDC domain-containing protein [Brevibacterium sp.]MDN6605355.1 HRDC domain-containing protein [Brevibacterium sp.]
MTTELPLLATPAHGVPPLVDTSEEFSTACREIALGSGPIAIDAERASGIRYGQRAFLVQLRRAESGTFLLDSELLADLSPLNSAFGDEEWVIHSATQDLPCLQERGMKPAALFDTELAARILGWEKFGLAAVAERTLGIRLAKEHSAADWSKRPLPEEWLNYAALDVEVLLPIRDILHEALVEAGRWEFAQQEFEHLLDFQPKHYPEPWRRTHGLSKLKSRRDMAKVRELWTARDGMAAESDTAPSRILRDRDLVALAQSRPHSSDDIMAKWPKLSRSDSGRLFRAYRKANGLPADELPTRKETSSAARTPYNHTDIKDRVAALRTAMAELAEEHTIPHDVLLQPAIVKALAAQSGVDVAEFLHERGARQWQIELSAPVLSSTLEDLPSA